MKTAFDAKTLRAVCCYSGNISDPDNCIVIDGDFGPRSRLTIGGDGQYVVETKPERPQDDEMKTWAWSEEYQEWLPVLTLVGEKQSAWASIKAARASAEYAPVFSGGYVYDADAESQRRIAAALSLAQQVAGWNVGWTTADNSVVLLDIDGIKALSLAVAQQVRVAYETAQRLREQIEVAETLDQVRAVKWPL
jgi:hypothetical protein